jgi:hypothetical protein
MATSGYFYMATNGDFLMAMDMIPTRKRCTTGAQVALHARADHIDSLLIDRGWLVHGDATDRNDPSLTMSEAAQAIGVARVTIDRGPLKFTKAPDPKECWRSSRCDQPELSAHCGASEDVDRLCHADQR